MNAFVWDEHVVTGLADVDDQHQGLVMLFNDLSQALFVHQGCVPRPKPGTCRTAF